MSKYTKAIRMLAKMNALDAETAEKLMSTHEEDGGPGSGNFGHRGRPGKKGGSAPKGGGSGNFGQAGQPGEKGGSAVPASKWNQSFKSVRPFGKNQRTVVYGGKEYTFDPSKLGPTTHKAATSSKPVENRTNGHEEESSEFIITTEPNRELLKPLKDPFKRKWTNRGERALLPQTMKPTSYEKGKTPYPPSEKGKSHLSPTFRQSSVAEKNNGVKRGIYDLKDDPEAMKKGLDNLDPGTMIRLNERGYSVFMKQKDGSWTYQKYHDAPVKVDANDVVSSIQKTGVMSASTPKEGAEGRDAYWDSIRANANLEPNAGDAYTGKRVQYAQAVKNGEKRARALAAGKDPFPPDKRNASAKYTQENITNDGVIHSTGAPTKLLPKGSGVTHIDQGDIVKPNPDSRSYNTLQEHCMRDAKGNLVLTPEREALHKATVEEVFKNAVKPGPGEKKVITFMGGGSAAGKGTIQKSGIADLPDDKHSPVIDADELKKRIPEYVDTSFSENHRKAASMGHEESSAMAKRAFDAGIANGYNFTLDGTGDGSLKSMLSKIEKAKANGYEVNGCYVTCPTELAVKRNYSRSEKDEYNREVPEAEVRKIHANVSKVFEEVAKRMNSCKLYDTDQPDGPKLIAEYRDGKEVFKDKALYKKFIDKALEGN